MVHMVQNKNTSKLVLVKDEANCSPIVDTQTLCHEFRLTPNDKIFFFNISDLSARNVDAPCARFSSMGNSSCCCEICCIYP
jgi:hypothetical protein